MKKSQVAIIRSKGTSHFPEFKTIELDDRDTISRFSIEYGLTSCEYSFANLYSWKDVHLRLWSLYRGRLLVLDNGSGDLFLPAGDTFSTADLVRLSGELRGIGLSGDIALVPGEFIASHPDLANHYTLQKNIDFADYIYATRKLTELKGKKLHKKKNLISQFQRTYPDYATVPVSPDLIPVCRRLAQKLLARKSMVSRTIGEEHLALKRALADFEKIGFEGLALLVAGKPVAFSVFSRLNNDMMDIHFEKADPAYKGAAQIINYETAALLGDRCRFLNREQDMGIPGLRQAKRSYDPERIETPYKLKFKAALL